MSEPALRTRARDGYCIVQYDGNKPGVPAHLRAKFTVQGQEFVTGETREIPAMGAGAIRASAFPGTVTIIDGTPVAYVPVRPIHQAEQGRSRSFSDAFTPPPAR